MKSMMCALRQSDWSTQGQPVTAVKMLESKTHPNPNWILLCLNSCKFQKNLSSHKNIFSLGMTQNPVDQMYTQLTGIFIWMRNASCLNTQSVKHVIQNKSSKSDKLLPMQSCLRPDKTFKSSLPFLWRTDGHTNRQTDQEFYFLSAFGP